MHHSSLLHKTVVNIIIITSQTHIFKGSKNGCVCFTFKMNQYVQFNKNNSGKTYLRLFEFLVVVSLQLYQRTEDVLVLIGILVAQQHVLGLLVHTRLLQVLQGRRRVFLESQAEY